MSEQLASTEAEGRATGAKIAADRSPSDHDHGGESREPTEQRIGLLWLRVHQAIMLTLFLGAWELVSGRFIDTFWIGEPTAISAVIREWIRSGFLIPHIQATFVVMSLGVLYGTLAGIAAGFILGLNQYLARMLDPVVTALYSVPKLALAPLFVLWLGIGTTMRVVFVANIVFFLIFWNTYAGVRDTDQELIDVVRLMGARKRDILFRVILPSSIPWIYVGLKLSIPFALTGAVVGEIIAGDKGLGFVLQSSASQFSTDSVFAVLTILMVLGLILNGALNRAEQHLMRWRR